MTINRRLPLLSGRAMAAALIITLAHVGTLAVKAGSLSSVTTTCLTPNTSAATRRSLHNGQQPESDSRQQETQQTRPRRVNPPDPTAQPSPGRPRPANGNSKRPANRNSNRPANGNSKRPANRNSNRPANRNSNRPAERRLANGNSNRPAERRPAAPVPKGNAGGDRQKGTGPSYTIQVAAFLEPEKAHRLAQSVSQKGYSAHVITRNDSQGKKWYCVRVGTYPDPDQAHKAATKMESKLKLKLAIRPSNSL